MKRNEFKFANLLFVVSVTAALVLVAACGSSISTPPPQSAAPTAATGSGVGELPPAERADFYQTKPELTIDTGRTYRATIQTSKGDIVVSLDATASPEHVNNFIFLSRQGFYNGLTFHRVEPGFVIFYISS